MNYIESQQRSEQRRISSGLTFRGESKTHDAFRRVEFEYSILENFFAHQRRACSDIFISIYSDSSDRLNLMLHPQLTFTRPRPFSPVTPHVLCHIPTCLSGVCFEALLSALKVGSNVNSLNNIVDPCACVTPWNLSYIFGLRSKLTQHGKSSNHSDDLT